METQSGCEKTLTVQRLALFAVAWSLVLFESDRQYKARIALVNIICGLDFVCHPKFKM